MGIVNGLDVVRVMVIGLDNLKVPLLITSAAGREEFNANAFTVTSSNEFLSVPFTALPDGATGVTEYEGKNLGFAVDEIGIIARNDFLAANPAAAKLFEVATLDINDISAENALIANGENTEEAIDKHATDWIAAHQAEYDGWLAEARKAAN